METATSRSPRRRELAIAVSIALFFALTVLSRSGWTGYVCGLLLVAGIMLNALVIALNGGCMPVAAELERAAEPSRKRYTPIGPATRLSVLGDWISFGPCLVSPGDALIVLGFVGGIVARIVCAI